MKMIQVLGTGCFKCKQLEQNARQAAHELGIEYRIEKVEDINRIVDFGVMVTPALVIDGEIRCTGTVQSIDDIKKYLQ